jgi:hypothetical protein
MPRRATVVSQLRRMLQRLLAVVGAVVALEIFIAGTWWLLERSLHKQFGSRPPRYLLIFGAFGSTLVGLIYRPAWTALQPFADRRCGTPQSLGARTERYAARFSRSGVRPGRAIRRANVDRLQTTVSHAGPLFRLVKCPVGPGGQGVAGSIRPSRPEAAGQRGSGLPVQGLF